MNRTQVLSAVMSLALASILNAQTISTKVLTAGIPIKIALSPALTTTLLFPSQISGTFGLGLVGGNTQSVGGSVQIEHPDGSSVLVLHAITETAHVIATVLLDGSLYVLELQSGPVPDVAVTLVRQGSEQDNSAAPKAIAVTPEDIVASRPKFDPEILISLLRRARDSAILQPLYHDLYSGYAKKEVLFTSDSGIWKTTVTTVHRFSKEDAVVLQGVLENESDKPLVFDGRAATVWVANEVHPIKLLDCLRPVPAHTKTLIDVVLQGDVDGGRANLSIDNSYRIQLPGNTGIWSLKNGAPQPSPSPLRQIPMAKAGNQ